MDAESPLPTAEDCQLYAAIRLLPEATINRIAAGEVIERPAAAARELVENALDAGARRIAVALDGGGIDRIEISDDGVGMTGEALALAVQRHATSKLDPLADGDGVLRVRTLGFRGEALPSIGAAARLAITSRPAGAAGAMEIRVEGGVTSAPAPAAGPPGTRVVVRDLFFATPARRKFLKSARAEAEATEASVRRLALAAPHVAFRLESDGRVCFDLPAQDRAARVAALLGPDCLPLISVQAARALAGGAEATLSGFVASPAVSRASLSGQALMVNNRPVADPLLRTAVRVACRDTVAAGRHAMLALWLDVPPEEVDVNVHPAKAELRFRDEAGVRALVIGGLGRALAGALDQGAVAQGAVTPGAPGLSGPDRPPMRFQTPAGRPGLRLIPPGLATGFAEAQLPLHAPPSARTPGHDGATSDAGPARAGSLEDDPPYAYPLGAALAQVLDTYIIAVAGDGSLVLVDQHAAHERLTHEAIAAQLHDGGVRAQPLLLPAVVDLPTGAAALLADHAATLATLGLELEPFGPGAILVRALPAVLGAPEPAPLLRDLADQLAECGAATGLQQRLDAIVARLACHGSIRAGRRLGRADMDALLRRMEATPRAATCSHGRPTVLKLSRAELERLFGRR